jgi:hypothetical protein
MRIYREIGQIEVPPNPREVMGGENQTLVLQIHVLGTGGCFILFIFLE